MNQAMLILLLSVLSGGTGNPYKRGAGVNPVQKSGMGHIRPITTRHMIRQMHEAIDALQRVEQISRLADFSTIRKREKEGYGPEGGHHDHKDSYIGNIREAFGNISDLLAGGGHDEKRDGIEEIHKQGGEIEEEQLVHESGYADSRSADTGDFGSGDSGGGMSQDALISLIGNLIGNMNLNNNGNNGSSDVNNNRNSFGNDNYNRSGNRNGFGNGLDIEKVMKMMNLISSFSNMNRR